EEGPDGEARAAAALQEQIDRSAERTGFASPLRLEPLVSPADDPADAILSRAREDDVDLLVMGTHGERAQRRELIGSVSSRVARDVECPLLLVPPGLWKPRQEREE